MKTPATYTIRRGSTTLECVATVPRERAEGWIAECRVWLARSRAPRSGDLRGGKVLRVEAPGSALVKVEVPSFARGLFSRMGGRGSRSRRAFETGLRLLGAGVPAAVPLARIEISRLGIVRAAFLLLEEAPGVELARYLADGVEVPARDPEARDRWASLSGALAHTTARLHAAGARQRDLKSPNILVDGSGSGTPRITLVDLEGMRLLRAPPSLRVRARDLGRLLVSLRAAACGTSDAEWRDFLGAYLEAAGLEDRALLERLAGSTLAWAERKEARNRRRGRPIE
jgi:tRNA A-37 threonylcarbamoyl transferase component Bud32